jgi:predicted GNAT family N-acyltransferase
MHPPAPFDVRLMPWADGAQRLSAVRRAVFIVEQAVPEALEWDDDDARSVHALAESRSGLPVGTARLLPDGHVGRMAVLLRWRRAGVGAALLRALLDEAAGAGHRTVRLNAQVRAIGFYERFGFAPYGPEFDDAGIPHRAMRLSLPAHRSDPRAALR